jgi:hypothetical protein
MKASHNSHSHSHSHSHRLDQLTLLLAQRETQHRNQIFSDCIGVLSFTKLSIRLLSVSVSVSVSVSIKTVAKLWFFKKLFFIAS